MEIQGIYHFYLLTLIIVETASYILLYFYGCVLSLDQLIWKYPYAKLEVPGRMLHSKRCTV